MDALAFLLAVFAVAFLLALPWAFLLRAVPARPPVLPALLVILAHGAFCTLGLLVLNSVPGYFGKNREMYSIVGPGEPSARDEGGAPARRFIAIDNTLDKTLVTDSLADEGEGALLAITHRGKLAQLLHKLAAVHERVGLVVCDITFTTPSPDDQALSEAILALAEHHKILVAKGPSDNAPLLNFNDDAMADATEALQEGMIAWHALRKNGRSSIPYAMLERLDGWKPEPARFGFITERRGAESRTAFPGFMPLWTGLGATQHSEGPFNRDDDALSIGYAIGAGWPLLESRLGATGEPLPVVFIGEFPPARHRRMEGDVHATFLGNHRGGELLIALYRDLALGAHLVRCRALLFQFLVLSLVSGLVFRRAWFRPCALRNRKPEADSSSDAGFVRMLGGYLLGHLRNQLPLLLFLIIMFVFRRLFGLSPNMAGLLGYLLILNDLAGRIGDARFKKEAAPGPQQGNPDPPKPAPEAAK